jgi:predicted  nucleic acid-binding Zn-ribbon protein
MMTRDEYVKDLTIKLEKLNSGINKIEHKAESVKENVKKKLQARIQELRAKRETAFLKVKNIKEATEESWQELTDGADKVVLSLKETMSKVLARFQKKKIE